MFKTRIGILSVLLGLAFLLVMGRLFQLQVIRYEKYRKLDQRGQSAQMVPAMRGTILDRHGCVLAEDRPYYDISVRADRLELDFVDVQAIAGQALKFRGPQNSDEESSRERARLRLARDAEFKRLVQPLRSEPFVRDLAQTLGREDEEIAAGLEKALQIVARGWASPRTPLRIVSGIDEKTWLGLRAIHEDTFRTAEHSALSTQHSALPYPGLVCSISTRRVYPHGSLACFALGSLGELSAEDEEALRQDGVLLDNAAARGRYWARLRENMSDETAARLEQILHSDPRDMRELGGLYGRLSRLAPHERTMAAALGLAEPLRWSERPPRVQLVEPEALWLGVGLPVTPVHNRLPSRTVGEMGVERYWNDILRGKSGMKLRDGDGDEDDGLSFRRAAHPREGQPLALTISLAWQTAVESALKSQDHPGAIVVLDANSFDVLAMASFPDFNPNLFSPPREGVERQEKIKALLGDPGKPLLNRAIAEQYPLGSVMKSLIAAVALEKGLVNTSETFECPGYIIEGGQKFRCDESRSHGRVNLMKGIRCSCNVTFQQIGARIGVENLAPYARQILGRRTGIDLPGEVPGIYPDRAWRNKAWPDNAAARVWTRGNDYLLAIGQGQLSCTVMQSAVLMAAIGNGGKVLTPRLWLDGPRAAPRPLGISPANLAIVRQGLDEVVNIGRPGERGTAYVPFHEHGPELAVRVAGKTSTAEHRKGAEPHAWFAGYAPAENPQVAFAVFLEEAGHGGAAAAPLAYRILREVYGTKLAPVKNPGGPDEVAAQ